MEDSPSSNHVPATSRYIRRLTGFSNIYNAVAWFVFGGALFAFCVARMPMANVSGFYRHHGGIGEYYYFTIDRYKVGLITHLVGILLCNIQAVFQFLPVIRQKAMVIHRLNGYAIFLLYLVGAAGGIVITRHAYGGHIDTQTAAGALAILVLIAFAIAWYQVMRLQIDQHRKWMLRALSMMASIVTSRIILVLAAAIVNRIDDYYETWPCDQLEFTVNDPQRFTKMYSECTNTGVARVKARHGYPEQTGSGHRITFGMSLWLAVAVHIILMEFYIGFTEDESKRLRQHSYERQLAYGMKNPGSAGITGDLFSKRKWKPPAVSDEVRSLLHN